MIGENSFDALIKVTPSVSIAAFRIDKIARGRPGEEIVVNRAPTYFGPLSYSLQAFGQQIRGTINLPTRDRYGHAWVNVRLPTDRKMVSVIINGKSWADFNPKTGRIGLPKTNETIQLMVNTTSR